MALAPIVSILVNGTRHRVLSVRTRTPRAPAHAYELEGGTVYEMDGEWRLQLHGEWPVAATVSSPEGA